MNPEMMAEDIRRSFFEGGHRKYSIAVQANSGKLEREIASKHFVRQFDILREALAQLKSVLVPEKGMEFKIGETTDDGRNLIIASVRLKEAVGA